MLLEPLAMRNPDVQMVSIGLDPEGRSQEPVLIVTMRHGAALPAALPDGINGLPVRVTYADYQLQQGEEYDNREETQTESRRPPANSSRASGAGETDRSGPGEAT